MLFTAVAAISRGFFQYFRHDCRMLCRESPAFSLSVVAAVANFRERWAVFLFSARPAELPPMSTNSPRTTAPAHRPPTGAPWWVWLVIGTFGLAVAAMLVKRISPEDASKIFTEALAAGEAGDRELLQQKLEQLRKYPAFESHTQFLDGVLYMGRSMPLKAIPLLRQASENPELRSKALLSLGRAYGTAGQLQAAITTLEGLVDDPESGNQARFIASGMLATAQSWDAAIVHLRALEKTGYEKPKVLYQLAEIEFDRGNYAAAETLYAAAIEEFPTDPTNGIKASRLLDCRLQLGTLKDSDNYIEMVDNKLTASLYRAENLLAAGKFNEARTAVERGMREAEGSPMMSFQLGKLALAEKNIDSAKQVLNEVLAACIRFPRSIDGMRILAQLAELVGDTDLQNKARQNLEQLDAARQQMRDIIPVVGSSLTDLEPRLRLAELARECGDADLMQKVFRGLMLFNPDKEGELTQRRQQLDEAPAIFVPFGREVTLPTNRGRVPGELPPGAPPLAPPPLLSPPVPPPPAPME
ncbi:MAG: MalT-like region [Planctomycetota bacterium]